MPHRLTVLLILSVIVLASTPIRADMPGELDIPSGTYKNDPAHTSLTWRIGHMGLSNFTARMNDVVIRLELDADDLTKSVVEATIDPASVDTGYPHTDKSFDDEVGKDARFLNATVFPSVTFVSNEISLDDDGQVLVVGDLTLLGISRSVRLSGILNGTLKDHPFAKVPAIGFTATTTIDRTDFGLDYLSGPILGDDVEIFVQAEFLKQ